MYRGYELPCSTQSLLDTMYSTQALERLTPREYYDRSFRFKRASQASVQHKTLPKEEWLDPKDVCHVDQQLTICPDQFVRTSGTSRIM
jgi:hypothetical protein